VTIVSANRKHDRKYFYKYTTARAAKTILVNKTVRCSSPLLFNDPFDVQRKLALGCDERELGAAVAKEVSRLVETGAPPETTRNPKLKLILQRALQLSPEYRRELAAGLLHTPWHDLHDLPSFQDLQRAWDSMIPRMRILSLTEINDNTAMWSHYADKYRGIVLKLECLDQYDGFLLLAEPVRYSDVIPTMGDLQYWTKSITGNVPFDYNALFKQLELTKTTNWSYEREWRVVSFEKDSNDMYSDYKVHPRTFTAVYLGTDVSDQDRHDFLNLSIHELSDMEVFQMRLDRGQRAFMFDRITQTT
jgi:hypothetical protein